MKRKDAGETKKYKIWNKIFNKSLAWINQKFYVGKHRNLYINSDIDNN